MKKRLLVTASTFPRWKGDTEPRFVLDLCKYMMDKYLVTVLVPAYPGAADEEFQEGVHIIRYHYFPIHKWEILCYPGAIIPRIKAIPQKNGPVSTKVRTAMVMPINMKNAAKSQKTNVNSSLTMAFHRSGKN